MKGHRGPIPGRDSVTMTQAMCKLCRKRFPVRVHDADDCPCIGFSIEIGLPIQAVPVA